MPKSKNRRKQKSNNGGAAGASSAVSADVIDGGAGDGPEASPQSAPAKKSSVSPFQFYQQVRAEMKKVTWTSRGETMISTIMVLIMVTIMSLFFFSVDQLLRFVMPRILELNLF